MTLPPLVPWPSLPVTSYAAIKTIEETDYGSTSTSTRLVQVVMYQSLRSHWKKVKPPLKSYPVQQMQQPHNFERI